MRARETILRGWGGGGEGTREGPRKSHNAREIKRFSRTMTIPGSTIGVASLDS